MYDLTWGFGCIFSVDILLLAIFREMFGVPLRGRDFQLNAILGINMVIVSLLIHWIIQWIDKHIISWTINLAYFIVRNLCACDENKMLHTHQMHSPEIESLLIKIVRLLLVINEIIITFALFDDGCIQYIQEYCTKRYRKYFQNFITWNSPSWYLSRILEIPLFHFNRYLYCPYIKVVYFKSKYLLEYKICRSIKRIRNVRRLQCEVEMQNIYYTSNNVDVCRRIETYLKQGGRKFTRDVYNLLDIIRRKMQARIVLAGSAAEFYSKPNGKYIGDLDFMCEKKNFVVEFQNGFHKNYIEGEDNKRRLEMYLVEDRIVESKSPYESALPTIISKYCKDISNECFFSSHGSATRVMNEDESRKIDFTESMRCINWPSQIQQWVQRERKNNWPDEDTINRVVNTGCDVIITPSQYAYSNVSLILETNVMRYSRILISFSKAEKILINSYTRKQQTVYYIMRRLANAELYSQFTPLNNYHIKTLMLWSVEEKPVEWWEENSELVICCELLKDL